MNQQNLTGTSESSQDDWVRYEGSAALRRWEQYALPSRRIEEEALYVTEQCHTCEKPTCWYCAHCEHFVCQECASWDEDDEQIVLFRCDRDECAHRLELLLE